MDELEGSAFRRLLPVAPGVSGGWCFAIFEPRRLRLENLTPQEAGKRKKAENGRFSHARSVRCKYPHLSSAPAPVHAQNYLRRNISCRMRQPAARWQDYTCIVSALRRAHASTCLRSATMKLTGLSILGFRAGSTTKEVFHATNARTGERLETDFFSATAEEVDAAAVLADEALRFMVERPAARKRRSYALSPRISNRSLPN